MGRLLRESDVHRAAAYLTSMQPDEAVDALRDLDETERAELLAVMPFAAARELDALLCYWRGRPAG